RRSHPGRYPPRARAGQRRDRMAPPGSRRVRESVPRCPGRAGPYGSVVLAGPPPTAFDPAEREVEDRRTGDGQARKIRCSGLTNDLYLIRLHRAAESCPGCRTYRFGLAVLEAPAETLLHALGERTLGGSTTAAAMAAAALGRGINDLPRCSQCCHSQ